MNYNIRGVNIEVTPAIREYVEKKLAKLERHFDQDKLEAKVNLVVYPNKQKVEVTIPLGSSVLRAEEWNGDVYAATDLAVDKLERQIRKLKTKVNRKLRDQAYTREIFITTPTEDTLDHEEELTVVRTKSFDLKPMDIEEAILQMNLVGHNFFVFKNTENHHKTSVVYSRKDGKYGLIDAL